MLHLSKLSVILAALVIQKAYSQIQESDTFSNPSTTIYHRTLNPQSSPPPFTQRGILDNNAFIPDPNSPSTLTLNRGEIYQIGTKRSQSGVQGEVLYSFLGIPAVSTLPLQSKFDSQDITVSLYRSRKYHSNLFNAQQRWRNDFSFPFYFSSHLGLSRCSAARHSRPQKSDEYNPKVA